MKKQYKIILSLIFLGIILISGCNQKEIPPEKYCEKDVDCLTSCGTKIGRGDCYNKNYFDFDDNGMLRTPIDNTCCVCDDVQPCFSCFCVNNQCVRDKQGGEC